MPELETMYWEKQGAVARLMLNRPHLLNAMNKADHRLKRCSRTACSG